MSNEMLIAYASRTGTKRNLAALRKHNWRLLVSATGCLRAEGFSYALDNGAWTAYRQGKPFDERAFIAALRKLGANADWTVIPDVVCGGHKSLEFSLLWMRYVLDESPTALLAVQDGLLPDDVRPFLGARVGIFVGGSTKWKESTIETWAKLGRELGSWVHVGRVNTARRIALCTTSGVTSFDGTSASRFAKSVHPLDSARRQLGLFKQGLS